MATLNTRGVTRLVILTRRSAIKIPRFWWYGHFRWESFLWGLQGNMQERDFSGQPGLCPVRWSIPGGWLLVMRRAEPIVRELTDAEYEAFADREDCSYHALVENKIDSFGILDGELVAIDYGGFGRCVTCREAASKLPA